MKKKSNDYDPKKDYSIEFSRACSIHDFRLNPYHGIKTLKLVGEKMEKLPGMDGLNIDYCKGTAYGILGQIYYWGVYKTIESDETLAIRYFDNGKLYYSPESFLFSGLLKVKNGDIEGTWDICEIFTRHSAMTKLSYYRTWLDAGEALYIIRQYLIKRNYNKELERFDSILHVFWNISKVSDSEKPGKQEYVRGLILLFDLSTTKMREEATIECREYYNVNSDSIEAEGNQRGIYFKMYNRLAEKAVLDFDVREYERYLECKKNNEEFKRNTFSKNSYKYNQKELDTIISMVNLNEANEYIDTLLKEGYTQDFKGIDLMERYKTKWSTLCTPEKKQPVDVKTRFDNFLALFIVFGLPLISIPILHCMGASWITSIIGGWIVLMIICKIGEHL
ncbi:MAG: hypothetical protein Q4D71_04885 [Oscillospiraceae bacterium]|nr:hypothetical protein [Oscillospiraceae bacterium]